MGLAQSIDAYRDRFDCRGALDALPREPCPQALKARARYLLHGLRLSESLAAVEVAHFWSPGPGYTLQLLTTQVEAAVLAHCADEADGRPYLVDAYARASQAEPATGAERELRRYLLSWCQLFSLGWEDAYALVWELLGEGSGLSPAKAATYRVGLAVAAHRLGEYRTAAGALRAAEFSWQSLEWVCDRALIAARLVAAYATVGQDEEAATWRLAVEGLPVPHYARRDLLIYSQLLAEALDRQVDVDLDLAT